MTLLAITGYASLDYAVQLAGPARADATTLIAHRDAGAWPRAGGCPAYIAAAAQKAGRPAAPICWVGEGAEGQSYRAALARQGLPTEGIATVAAPRSPTALMVHQPDGSCLCLYDPALGGQERLTAAQRALLGRASHLCISVGPPQLQDEILAACPPAARLYWVLKRDAVSFPDALCARLSARADVILCNASERDMIAATGATIVETRGRAGVLLHRAGDAPERFEVESVDAVDTTGAGDTLAGGFIAAEMAGQRQGEAVGAGIAAAAALLRGRTERETP